MILVYLCLLTIGLFFSSSSDIFHVSLIYFVYFTINRLYDLLKLFDPYNQSCLVGKVF